MTGPDLALSAVVVKSRSDPDLICRHAQLLDRDPDEEPPPEARNETVPVDVQLRSSCTQTSLVYGARSSGTSSGSGSSGSQDGAMGCGHVVAVAVGPTPDREVRWSQARENGENEVSTEDFVSEAVSVDLGSKNASFCQKITFS